MADIKKMTAAEFAEKQATRTVAAVPDYRRGIDRVDVAPGVKAAAKADKMLSGVKASIESGKWGERVKSVSLDEWKGKALNKGAGRIEGGVREAKGKVEAFAEQLIPFVTKVKADIATMPDLTLEDSKRRMLANVDAMSKFRFKR